MSMRRPIPLVRQLSTSAASPHAVKLKPSAPRDRQTLVLPSGRVLGFAEYGNPTGFPLFYFHGFPSSRLEGHIMDDVGQKHDLRILSLDRPGFGLSTFQPRRCIVDWPADVEAFADHARLGRFAVLGASGGGPYALACARSLPPDRLAGVGLLSSAAPWAAGPQYLRPLARKLRWWTRYFPGPFRLVADPFWWMIRRAMKTEPGQAQWADDVLQAMVDGIKKVVQEDVPLKNRAVSSPDKTAAQRREEQMEILGDLSEAFAQGSRACVQEHQLITNDWGFPWHEVTYPIKMWHGVRDRNAPIQMIRYMAHRLPNCELFEYDRGHFDMHLFMGQILDQLVRRKESKKERKRRLSLSLGSQPVLPESSR
ncbi:alpha/beta-hydrolase [Calocera viscosa TUFC12733]|uniref:Alpha/beta-hydrolase n=1 Tax=Calocera viscosa (strain TUFC12733) TaxID=1330018 RepID=A0A167NAQ3_CALVF|nr:alpha/beta-hydrolase [Calocera viscosa TUFC12733]